MSRVCPYCQFVSVDKTSHKLHLRASHASQIDHCLAQSVKGQVVETKVMTHELPRPWRVVVGEEVYFVNDHVHELIMGMLTQGGYHAGTQMQM